MNLYDACRNGSIKSIHILLKRGFRRYKRAIEGACRGGNIKLFQELTEYVNNHDSSVFDHCMLNACEGGHQELVDYLINNYEHIYGISFYNYGLYGACKGGNQNLIKMITKYKDIDIDMIMGLEGACEGGHHEIVEKFLIIDAINIALRGACRGGHQDLVEYFINKGAYQYQMAIEGACKGGHLDLLKFLIKKNNGNINLDSAICCAAMGGNKKLIKFLLSSGATQYNFPLYYSIQNEHHYLMKLYYKEFEYTDNIFKTILDQYLKYILPVNYDIEKMIFTFVK